jgi:class 3 adenylate cyclase
VSEDGVERRLTTILAADIVGYGRLMAADEAGTQAQFKAHRKEFFEPRSAQCGDGHCRGSGVYVGLSAEDRPNSEPPRMRTNDPKETSGSVLQQKNSCVSGAAANHLAVLNWRQSHTTPKRTGEIFRMPVTKAQRDLGDAFIIVAYQFDRLLIARFIDKF